jgi:hypothetical protein
MGIEGPGLFGRASPFLGRSHVMKRLALVAALAVLPACTTVHPDRRTLTEWNLDLLRNTTRVRPSAPCDRADWDAAGNPLINWILVAPIEAVMLPGSWLVDTLVVNPINGWEKAELQSYNRRFGRDDELGVSESGLQNAQLAPGVAPWIVGDVLAAPEFLGHWLWNSIYWTDPVNKESWNQYWNDHHERSTQ